MNVLRRNRILLLIVLMAIFSVFPQFFYGKKDFDSLLKLIPAKTGKEKMRLLEKAGYYYRHRNPLRAIDFGYQALRYARLVDNRDYYFTAYSILSLAHRYHSDLDSALFYGEKAMEIANATHDTSQNYLANNRLGVIYRYRGHYLTSIALFTRAISFATSERMRADLYNNIGISYRMLGNYAMAMEYYTKTLEIRKQTNDSLGYAYILNNIANLYGDMDQYRKALNTMRQSIHIKKQLYNNPYDISIGYGNLAEFYLLMRDSSLYDSAFYFIHKAEEQALIAKNASLRNIALDKLAKYYQIRRKYQESTVLYDSILRFYDSTEMVYELANTLIEIASNRIAEKKYALARKNLVNARKMILRHDILPLLMKYYRLSSKLYVKRNAYKKAYTDLQALNELKSKIFTAEMQQKLTDIEVKKQIESKEKDNRILLQQNMLQKAKLSKKNTIIYFSLSLFALLFIFLFSVYMSFRALKEKNRVLVHIKEELETSQEKLLFANNIKNKLFSIITHDILNGFHPIHGMLEYISQNIREMRIDEIDKAVNDIFRGATSNLLLMTNILSWGKSQMNNFELHPENLNVYEIIEENLRNLSVMAKAKRIHFLNRISPAIEVRADREAMLSIVRNLCYNAIKYSPEGEKIIISSSEEGVHVKICIKDHGIGMTPEKIELIFKGLEIQSQEGTKQEKGSGLGLLVTKEFIERSGGKLSIESKINQGTKMCFTLPKPANS